MTSRTTSRLAIDVPAARTVGVRRRRWRSYLVLSRISNVPTVWTNVLAGMCLSSVVVSADVFFRVALAISLFYAGGMFLNDAFDASFDRRFRPERPIPSEDLTRTEVFVAGGGLLAAGELLLASRAESFLFGLALAAAIVLYDFKHKETTTAPLVMGTCRALVYCIAAASVAEVNAAVAIGAAVVGVYVVALTVVSKFAGREARWLIPSLIAGISLLDAALIALLSPWRTVAVAATGGFALTLFLQRYVRGD